MTRQNYNKNIIHIIRIICIIIHIIHIICIIICILSNCYWEIACVAVISLSLCYKNVGLTNKLDSRCILWNMVPRALEVLGMWSALTWPVQSSTVCLRQDIGIVSRALFQTNFF